MAGTNGMEQRSPAQPCMGQNAQGAWTYVPCDQASSAPPAPAAAPTPATAPSPSLQGLFDAGNTGSDPAVAALSGGSGGPGGAKVVDPASSNASMQGLMEAGGSASDAGGANMLSGPTHFRGNIGARMIPDQNSPLAGMRKVY